MSIIQILGATSFKILKQNGAGRPVIAGGDAPEGLGPAAPIARVLRGFGGSRSRQTLEAQLRVSKSGEFGDKQYAFETTDIWHNRTIHRNFFN